MDTFTPVNRLDVPEIAHYQRTTEASGRVVIVYAVRKPLMSLWTGVRIEIKGDTTIETNTHPQVSAAHAIELARTPPPKHRGDLLELMLPARK